LAQSAADAQQFCSMHAPQVELSPNVTSRPPQLLQLAEPQFFPRQSEIPANAGELPGYFWEHWSWQFLSVAGQCKKHSA
jgi:hypothetical protein